MKPFLDEKRVKDKKAYRFVPKQIKQDDHEKVRATLYIFRATEKRIKRYAKLKNIPISWAIEELLDTAEAKAMCEPLPSDWVKNIRSKKITYASYSIYENMKKPRSKVSVPRKPLSRHQRPAKESPFPGHQG